MSYDINSKRINCNYFTRCSSLKSASNLGNLIETYCSCNSPNCTEKLSIITKELKEKIRI